MWGFLSPPLLPSMGQASEVPGAPYIISAIVLVPCMRALFACPAITTFIPCQPSFLCYRAVFRRGNRAMDGVTGGAGVRPPTVSTPGWPRGRSDLQAEPAPQGAADLQAGLAALITVGTQHVQLTHLPIDLCGPHSACAWDGQVPHTRAQPGTQCIVRPEVSSAALTSLGLTGPGSFPCSCQMCPPPIREGHPHG